MYVHRTCLYSTRLTVLLFTTLLRGLWTSLYANPDHNSFYQHHHFTCRTWLVWAWVGPWTSPARWGHGGNGSDGHKDRCHQLGPSCKPQSCSEGDEWQGGARQCHGQTGSGHHTGMHLSPAICYTAQSWTCLDCTLRAQVVLPLSSLRVCKSSAVFMIIKIMHIGLKKIMQEVMVIIELHKSFVKFQHGHKKLM